MRGFNEMCMCISFELYYELFFFCLLFFFFFLFGVKVYYLSSGGTIPTNHPGSVSVI